MWLRNKVLKIKPNLTSEGLLLFLVLFLKRLQKPAYNT
jgi:hypothetical protein